MHDPACSDFHEHDHVEHPELAVTTTKSHGNLTASVGPVRLHFPFLIQRELFTQKEIFGGECGSRAEAQTQKAPDISKDRVSGCRKGDRPVMRTTTPPRRHLLASPPRLFSISMVMIKGIMP